MLDSASFFQALRRLLRPSPASKPAGPSPQSPTRPLPASLLGSRAFFFRMRSCDPTPRCPNEASGPMGNGSRVRLALVHWSKENMDRPFSLQNNTLLQIKSQMVTSTKNPSTLRQGPRMGSTTVAPIFKETKSAWQLARDLKASLDFGLPLLLRPLQRSSHALMDLQPPAVGAFASRAEVEGLTGGT